MKNRTGPQASGPRLIKKNLKDDNTIRRLIEIGLIFESRDEQRRRSK